jgi:hypothetical protein
MSILTASATKPIAEYHPDSVSTPHVLKTSFYILPSIIPTIFFSVNVAIINKVSPPKSHITERKIPVKIQGRIISFTLFLPFICPFRTSSCSLLTLICDTLKDKKKNSPFFHYSGTVRSERLHTNSIENYIYVYSLYTHLYIYIFIYLFYRSCITSPP